MHAYQITGPIKRQFRKLPWRLLFVIVIVVAAIIVDLPRIPLNVTVFGKHVKGTLEHPAISFGNNNGSPVFYRDLNPKLGLDLQGGTEVTLEADMSQIPQSQRQDALNLARTVIERRVNLFGVSEPLIQTAQSGNKYHIIVDLPGIKDEHQAVAEIGQTAKLEFRMFPPNQDASASAQIPTIENTVPTGLDGSDLQNAQVTFEQQTGAPQVSFSVVPKSQDKFYNVTNSLIGKPMAIFLDNQPISAPIVNQAIRDSGVISGQFTTDDANQLALQLNAGTLKTPIKVVGQQNVGATLGAESIQTSILAGVIGFAIISLFMILNYGSLGLIADAALIVYTLLTFAVFKIIPVTLTLAGIAGFILSIGMAVDANILIFERMKEEIRWGKSKGTALHLGFDRAMPSIKASNFSTLITTAILYWLGTGFVRGFALTLAVGVILSLFSAVYVSKTLLKVFAHMR